MQEQIGIRIRAYDLDGEDLGQIHLPAPVLVRDVTAFEQRLTHEVIVVLQDDDGLLIAAKLRPVRFRAVRR